MEKVYLLMVMALLSFSKIQAQKFEMGKVSIAELEEKAHPKDASAEAAFLFKKGETRFEYSEGKGFEMVTKVKARIKIYKKEGYDWANHDVQYYLENNSVLENLSFSNVATYNLVDGKIVKTKIKSDGEFDEKINRYWGRKKIALPAIKEGSVIEYEYVLKSPNYGKFKQWEFQTSIPINYSEFKTYVPEYFVYNVNQKGSIWPKATVVKNHKSIVFMDKERSNGNVTTTSFSSSKVDYEETATTYVLENIPALRDESYVNNISNYTSSLSHELAMTKFPNNPYKNYSTNWESVTKTIYDNEDFGAELNKSGYFENDIKALLASSKTQGELVAAIFNHVKSNVKWDGYYGFWCNDGVKKAYKDKTGNVGEINLMLTAMLRYAGLKANPVLLSTRTNGISFFASRTAFNYVICAIELPEGTVLLDATDKYALPNVLPVRDLNWFGRLIRKDGTSVDIDLLPKMVSKENVFVSMVVKNDGSLSGKIRKQFTDYEAFEFRQQNLGLSQDSYLEGLESKNNSIEVSDYVRENDLDLSKPVMETYSFLSTRDTEMINGKIYLSPLVFLRMKDNPFKQEKREYPVDFKFPTQNKYTINIEIPEGYVVESLPSAANLLFNDDMGAFKFLVGVSGNKIQVTVTSDINASIVSAEYYEVLKEYFQKMVDKGNEKIVLVKA